MGIGLKQTCSLDTQDYLRKESLPKDPPPSIGQDKWEQIKFLLGTEEVDKRNNTPGVRWEPKLLEL